MVQGAARHQQREALAQARTREREREAQFREKLGQVRVILMRPLSRMTEIHLRC
eukprot:COSAG01_NODE_2616_length_7374_cov_8.288031_8_plen_54_part_00